MGLCWWHKPASPCASLSLPALASSSTTLWELGGSIAISQRHYAESSISTALTSSSKEIWAYNLHDKFDEPFTNVEIQDSIVVRCDMCCKTSHGPRNSVGRSSKGEQKARGEAGSCHGENKLRGCLMPQTRPHHSTHFFFKCSEAVANSSLTTPSLLLC